MTRASPRSLPASRPTQASPCRSRPTSSSIGMSSAWRSLTRSRCRRDASSTKRKWSSAAACPTACTPSRISRPTSRNAGGCRGRLETVNVPPGSKRACRAVLTQDFDDRQGEMKTMYTAVVFNPVPGPPMGKKPHLSFRYFLKGTDVLRVQIYSLTNGYHRCLTLKGLPQGKWMDGNVDMTRRPQARRHRRPAVGERTHRRHPVLLRSARRIINRRHRFV